MRHVTTFLIAFAASASAAITACSNHAPALAPPPAVSPAVSPDARGCSAAPDPTGTYALSFVMQGSPVDMTLTVRRDATGALAATTRSMGTRVDARHVVANGCTLHIDLDPAVAGEGQIDLKLDGDRAAGTLTWQGQPTGISGKRVP